MATKNSKATTHTAQPFAIAMIARGASSAPPIAEGNGHQPTVAGGLFGVLTPPAPVRTSTDPTLKSTPRRVALGPSLRGYCMSVDPLTKLKVEYSRDNIESARAIGSAQVSLAHCSSRHQLEVRPEGAYCLRIICIDTEDGQKRVHCDALGMPWAQLPPSLPDQDSIICYNV